MLGRKTKALKMEIAVLKIENEHLAAGLKAEAREIERLTKLTATQTEALRGADATANKYMRLHSEVSAELAAIKAQRRANLKQFRKVPDAIANGGEHVGVVRGH